MRSIITIGQLIISIILVILVLIQDRGEGIGESLGGTQSGGFAKTRRGLEKKLHIATIVLVILFGASSLVLLLI